MTLRKGSEGHANESYQDFGSRCLALGARLTSLLGKGAAYQQETTSIITVNVVTGTGTTASTSPRTFNDLTAASTHSLGYTAADLARDLALSMIPIGLGKEDGNLRHTLNHLPSSSDTNDLLDHLRKADSLSRNTLLAEGTSSTALAAAKNSKKEKRKLKFTCSVHGPNHTHADENCRAQKQKAQVADNPITTAPEERVMMAQVAHIASAPRRRSPRTLANSSWNPDSGATSHMTPHRNWIRNLTAVRVAVSLANNEIVWATGKGDVYFTPKIHGRIGETLIFHDVLYVPALQNNLFSILSAVRKSKMRVVIEGESLEFFKEGQLLLTASIRGITGMLDGSTLMNSNSAAVFSARIGKDLLHQRLGHIGKDRLETLLRQDLATGILVHNNSQIEDVCEHCIAGKQHRDPFPQLSEHRSHELLGHIYSDLHGPLPQTVNGYKYWITFIDDFS